MLAMGDLTHTLDSGLAGQAPCAVVAHAANMVGLGVCRNVVVYRALNGRSGQRVGSARAPGEASDLRYAAGLTAYPQTIAMWARRFMIDTGATEADLAAVAIAQRDWAADNPRAIRRRPLTLEEHHASPYVASPLRSVDCTTEVDGACAVVVTSIDAASDAPHPAVGIEGAAYALGRGGGLDMADVLTWPDLSRNYTSFLARVVVALRGARAVRHRRRRDLRLLLERRAVRARRSRLRRARRRGRPRPVRSDPSRRRAARQHQRRTSLSRATCTA